MLGLFIGGLFPIQGDLGIALTRGHAGHAQIHTDLGALAVEVGLQLLEDVSLILFGHAVELGADAEHMLSCQLDLAFDLDELCAGNAAERALFGRGVTLMDITADRTYVFHCGTSIINISFCACFQTQTS